MVAMGEDAWLVSLSTGRWSPSRACSTVSVNSSGDYLTGVLGFFPWYRALALGGVARISQIQLAQPVLTLVWSALLLGEHIDAITILAAVLVLLSVAASQRMRVRRTVAVGYLPEESQTSIDR